VTTKRRGAFFARRRSGVWRFQDENEDEAQARNLVIASAGEAIQPWSESRIASSLPLLAMTSGGIQRVAHSADWRSVIR
jgi:hypothetical protein